MCTNEEKEKNRKSHTNTNILKIFDLWNGILMKTEDGKKAFYSKIDQKKQPTTTHAHVQKPPYSHYHYSNYAEMNIHFTRHLHNSVQFNNFNVAVTNASISYFDCFKPMHSMSVSFSASHLLSLPVNVPPVSVMSCFTFSFLQVPFLWKY